MNCSYTRLCLLFMMSSAATAQESATINGNSHLSNAEYDAFKINGSLTFHDLTIKNLRSNGDIKGTNLACDTIKSNGFFDVEGVRARNVCHSGSFVGKNVEITGDAKFNGNVEITDGTLNTVEIYAPKVAFTNVKITGNTLVKKRNTSWEFFGFSFKSNNSSPQILELKGKSVILSDIIFEEGGEVHAFNGVKIKGQVVNGKVVQK